LPTTPQRVAEFIDDINNVSSLKKETKTKKKGKERKINSFYRI